MARSSIRNSDGSPSRRHLVAADAAELDRLAVRRLQRAHQRGAEAVAGFLGRDEKDLHADAHRRLGKTDDENAWPGRRFSTTLCGSATIVPPASTASPARPAAITPSIVRGPIDGRSKRRSWPGFGALTSTPTPCGARIRPLRAQFGDARQHLVGALRRLDREHMVGSATTTACPTSKRPDRAQHSSPRAMSARSRADGRICAKRAFRHQDFRRHLMRAEQAEAVLLEHARHAGQQMIVAAIEMADRSAAAPAASSRSRPINCVNGRPHHGADEDHVAAAFLAREPQKRGRAGRHATQ